MLQVCRAEDGQVFQTEGSWQDIERFDTLEVFLQEVTRVEAEAVLAYVTDGRRLTKENIRELAGMQDQMIFVFNKAYLDYDFEQVLHSLQVEPQLQPPIEESISATPPFRPSQLATSYLRTAHTHQSHLQQIAMSLQYQQQALQIALYSLDKHVLTLLDTFESISSSSQKELTKQASLLGGVEADLDLIGRVQIHHQFMSAERRRAVENGEERERTLSDYVSNVKMRQVAETCKRTHEELQSRFNEMAMMVRRLQEGVEVIRASVTSGQLLDDADNCIGRAQAIFEKLSDRADSLQSPNPNSEADGFLQELKQLDAALRQELEFIVEVKNSYTHHTLVTLRHIGALNNDLLMIPPGLSALQASFRGGADGKKNPSFSHIERLHGMIYAYGATVVEIVRRKEFCDQFFYQRAQSILDIMAKLSSNERKRRQIYRSEIHGNYHSTSNGCQRRMIPRGAKDGDVVVGEYGFERSDVDGLFRLLDDLENLGRSTNDASVLSAVVECRTALEKQIAKMDGLEASFDKIAERSLLSMSRISHSRRRCEFIIEQDEQMFQEVVDQLRSVQDSKAHLESLFNEERLSLKSEIHRLQSQSQDIDANASSEHERADRLERELHQVRAQLESEGTARRIMEERYHEVNDDLERQRLERERALHDATEQTRAAEVLKQELAQVKSDFEEVKALEARNSEKMANLLEEQANNLRILEEARARGEDLEEQIQAARAESEEVHVALKEASLDKDRLLRMQANEHDRIMRDHIAEADGDRAVLERQFFEVKAVLEHTERLVKDLRSELDVANADAVGLREELHRVQHELREARHAEKVLRDDLKTGKSSQEEYEQKLEDKARLVAQILDVALAFRASHLKALSTAQAIASHPRQQSVSLAESAFSPSMRHSQPDESAPIEIDPSDPATALEVLRTFDHDHFQEAITKTGSVVRKWQKQCKEYRERAKGKISFRNFAKGDLALFLPTRNSVSKPWAAFNVSFPHYFLQATGHLAEQLKSREWIVARITSITERVVDRNDPSSNPYGLGDGVKYYMLEVEDWTQPSNNKRRVSSKKQSNNDAEPGPSTSPGLADSTSMLPPPEPEVEDTFQVAANSPSTRANSSPSARPSSLSRLLAQAPPETPDDAVPTSPKSPPRSESPKQDQTEFPTTSPPPPPSPSLPSGSVPRQAAGPLSSQSPLRPGSRASRLSTTSRFSGGRIPPLGSASTGSPVKAVATTALSSDRMTSSPSSGEVVGETPNAPSPEGSISEGMTSVFKNSRRRTSSYHVSRNSPLAVSESSGLSTSSITASTVKPAPTATSTLASFANSWGAAFSRKKKTEMSNLAPTLETSSAGGENSRPSDSTASEMLRRF
ncbi:hypothetical protein K435DRAFT_818316 [Dendrothele bispora CBS 962.96]|uniref:Autophagy-related protein 11 n=1 Tax=Dendrothele bispora (strain CBS 962.96) TaxID=1314807 RepID=A0A4S8MD31_DENBC|nr:hypothetical protein K435DRAFT_818316 [Dendrothele bispora CBS 962.96]